MNGMVEAGVNAKRKPAQHAPLPSSHLSETWDELSGFVSGVPHDLRQSFRALVLRPGFVAIAVLNLGLGIGAIATIFSCVNSVLLDPLPFKEPDRLIRLTERDLQNRERESYTRLATLDAWTDNRSWFSQMSAYIVTDFDLTGGEEAERVPSVIASTNFFSVLGIEPLVGRFFQPEDADQDVVVLGNSFWAKHFGADSGVIGRQVSLNGVDHQVIGVAPPAFDYWGIGWRDLWLPLGPDFGRAEYGHRNWYFLVNARLKPGVDARQAESRLRDISAGLADSSPGTHAGWGVRFDTFPDLILSGVRPVLLLLLAAVGLVLIISCVNAASLQLARATSRRREIAMRTALGAGNARIARQLMSESLLLASMGGAVGLLVAWGGVWLIVYLATAADLTGPTFLARMDEVKLDGDALLFTLCIALGSALLFGLAPILYLFRSDINQSIKEGFRGAVSSRKDNRQRRLLLGAEVTSAVLMLIVAGLLLRSVDRLLSVDPGFNPHGVVCAQVYVPFWKYGRSSDREQVFNRLMESVRTLPGIESAAGLNALPVGDFKFRSRIAIEGQPPVPQGQEPTAIPMMITSGYSETLGVPIRIGRQFTPAEIREPRRHRVAIVNETMAQLHWPNQSPVGRTFRSEPGSGEKTWTIIGVSKDERLRWKGLERPIEPAFYTPFSIASYPFAYLAVRTTGDPLALADALRDRIREVDRDLPIPYLGPLTDVIDKTTAIHRFGFYMAAVLACIALLLAGLGVYGVTLYAINQRRAEIGVRQALGASRARILAWVLGRSLRTAALGILAGLLLAFGLTRYFQDLLFQTNPHDPTIFISVSFLILAVTAIASLAPAFRASRTDPVHSLQTE